MADKKVDVIITFPCIAGGLTRNRGERLSLPIAEAMLLVGSNRARIAKAVAETATATAPDKATASGQDKGSSGPKETGKK